MPGQKIRICFLLQGISHGGGTKSFLLLLKSLNNDLFEKYVLSISSGAEEIEQEIIAHSDHFEIMRVESIAYNQSYHTTNNKFQKYSQKDYSGFVDKLRKLRIDILHVNSTIFPQILRWVKEHSDIKTVTHIREHIFYDGNDSEIQKYILDQTIKYSDALIAISSNEAEAFKSHKNLAILPNPFDFSKLNNINKNFRSAYGIDSSTTIVGMMSQFIPNKGHLDLLRSLALVKQKENIKSKFLFVLIGIKDRPPLWKRVIKKIVGIPDYRSMIDQYVAENHLNEDILLVPVSNSIFCIISDCDILVRPSLAGDPWGRDIIEAMAMKKPVVATGESEFYVEDGKTGYLVPPNNPTQLAQKIADLIEEPQKRVALGENGYKKVRAMCDINSYGERISSIYKSLLKDA